MPCESDRLPLDGMPSDPVIDEAARLLKGLADPTRIRILCLLRPGEACVHQLVDALEVTQSAVSHQLRTLREARLVRARKVGRHVYYSLSDVHVADMLTDALAHGQEGV